MTTSIDRFAAALATVSVDFEYTVSESDYRGEPAITLSDTSGAGDEYEIAARCDSYERQSCEQVAALERAGFKMRESGANGGQEGGFYSIWTPVLTYRIEASTDASANYESNRDGLWEPVAGESVGLDDLLRAIEQADDVLGREDFGSPLRARIVAEQTGEVVYRAHQPCVYEGCDNTAQDLDKSHDWTCNDCAGRSEE